MPTLPNDPYGDTDNPQYGQLLAQSGSQALDTSAAASGWDPLASANAAPNPPAGPDKYATTSASSLGGYPSWSGPNGTVIGGGGPPPPAPAPPPPAPGALSNKELDRLPPPPVQQTPGPPPGPAPAPVAPPPRQKPVGSGGGATMSKLDAANQDQLDALDWSRNAQVNQANVAAKSAAQRADYLALQAENVNYLAGKRDAEYEKQIQKINDLSDDVAKKKIDPDRFYKNMTTGQSIGWTLAAALSGFSAGWNHKTGNIALQAMQERANADIEAQKEDIQSGRVRVEDAKGVLGEMYRRYGNMEQAEQAARILGLQHMDSIAEGLQDKAGSGVVAARIEETRASLNAQIQQDKARLAASAAAAASAQSKKEHEEALKRQEEEQKEALRIFEEAARAGKKITMDDAHAIVQGKGPSSDAIAPPPKPPKDNPGQAQIDRQMRATEEAIAGVDKMINMVNAPAWDKISPARTAEGKAILAQTKDNLALSTTGRSPTKQQLELANEALPEDPNSFQWTGSDWAKLKATKGQLVQRLRMLKQASVTGTGAGSDDNKE